MKVYRISAENARQSKAKARLRAACLIGALIIFSLVLAGVKPGELSAEAQLFFGFLTGLAIAGGMYVVNRRFADFYSSFEITSDDQIWARKQEDTPEVTLARSEVWRVEELQGHGFRICTSDRHRNIWVPSELDGYEQLKAEVLSLPGVETTRKQTAWLRAFVILAAVMLLLVISLRAADKRLAAGASLAMAMFYLVFGFERYRNSSMATQAKRVFLWAMAAAGLVMLIRAAVVWWW